MSALAVLNGRAEGQLRYKKPPILEAVLEFRWSEPRPLEALVSVLRAQAFDEFEESNPRMQIDAAVSLDEPKLSHSTKQLGFEASLRDGSQIVFLEQQKFVFVQRAPYDRLVSFSADDMSALHEVTSQLAVDEFSRVGLRYVNRIDIPLGGNSKINTDDYVTIKFDGPRKDRGIIEEFQMRVVKPTEKEGIHYALVVATTASPLTDHSAILLDIDMFTRPPVPAARDQLDRVLKQMRTEKNEIFQECLTDKARDLFGGLDE